MNKNKVEFGTEMFHIGTYSVSPEGVVTLSKPVHVPGMRALALESDSEESDFFADNVKYYSDFTDNGLKGDLKMALFPDSFKTAFLNYKAMADGGIAQVKGMPGKSVYFAFQGHGDKEKRRHLFLNASLGAIKREHKTLEGKKDVEEETLPITVVGDNASGIVKITYSEGDSGYANVFTNPTIPEEVGA